MKRLYGLTASEDHCVLATPHGDEEDSGEYMLSLCNSLGTTVDSKQIALEPLFVAMSNSYVFAANKDFFFEITDADAVDKVKVS